MRQKYRQLDIFKLDVIARELKRLEGRVKLVRDEAGTLGALAKAAAGGQARQREQLGQLSQRVGTELDGCRGLVRDVINQCLTDMQKLHIGHTVGEDRLAAGHLKQGGVLSGYVSAGPVDEVHSVSDSESDGSSEAAHPRQQLEMDCERQRQQQEQ